MLKSMLNTMKFYVLTSIQQARTLVVSQRFNNVQSNGNWIGFGAPLGQIKTSAVNTDLSKFITFNEDGFTYVGPYRKAYLLIHVNGWSESNVFNKFRVSTTDGSTTTQVQTASGALCCAHITDPGTQYVVQVQSSGTTNIYNPTLTVEIIPRIDFSPVIL